MDAGLSVSETQKKTSVSYIKHIAAGILWLFSFLSSRLSSLPIYHLMELAKHTHTHTHTHTERERQRQRQRVRERETEAEKERDRETEA